MTTVTPLGRTLRALLAVAVACSWLLLAGLPAGALVTNFAVQSPKADAALKQASPLVVIVDRTTAPEDEKVQVLTKLFYGGTPPPPEPEPEPEPTEEPSPEAEEQDATTQEEQAQQQPAPAKTKPVSKKVIALGFVGRKDNPPAAEKLRFRGLIDPYNLAWLPRGGTAPNGQYTLEYVADSNMRDGEEWRRFEFRLDAPPAPQGAPGVGVQDAAAKRMVVAWQPNPTPDLTSYRVERRLGSAAWTVAKDKIKPDTTQITDTVGKYGSYQYRVTAVRPAGDGSKKSRVTTSAPSLKVQLLLPSQAAPPGPSGGDGTDPSAPDDGSTGGDTGTTTSPGSSSSSGGSVPSFSGAPSTSDGFSTQTDDTTADPGVAPPAGFEDTFQGPLDYNVQQDEVTERVPVDIAQGGGPEEGGTLTVLNRAIDQQRVLPPVAGGLILVISAAHVLRYLNE